MSVLQMMVWMGAMFLMVACGEPEVNQEQGESPDSKRLARMTPEERKKVAPNDLFEAIYESNENEVSELVKSKPELLTTVNQSAGDRPLATAILLKESAIALEIARHLAPQDLFYQNQEGQGYLFLAAKEGQTQVINALAKKYWNEVSGYYVGDFKELDVRTLQGQRALHVAATAGVANLLEHYWWKGFVNVPYNAFTRATDIEGRSFLHTAAADGRVSLLEWGKTRFCKRPMESDEKGWLDKGMEILGYMKSFAQMFAPSSSHEAWVELRMRNRFNWVDLDGQSPLHHAVAERQEDAVVSVLGCDWVDPTLRDEQGRTSLLLHLEQISKTQAKTSKTERLIFERLVDHRQKGSFWQSRAGYLNLVNKDNESALHMAARLADGYYYERLIELGADPYLHNQSQITPQQLFDQTRARQERFQQ